MVSQKMAIPVVHSTAPVQSMDTPPGYGLGIATEDCKLRVRFQNANSKLCKKEKKKSQCRD